jgi:hypothetical protein
VKASSFTRPDRRNVPPDRLATIRVWSRTYEKGIKRRSKYHKNPAQSFYDFFMTLAEG